VTDIFSEYLQDLTSAALEQGVEAATRGKDDFPPFALVDAGGEGVLTVGAGADLADRPLDEQVEGLREVIRGAARQPDAVIRAAAVVYDTFLTLDEERSDAVVVEAYEAGQPGGVMVGLRYTPKRGLRKGRSEGQPIVLQDDLDPIL
jgi:hypothetical protein